MTALANAECCLHPLASPIIVAGGIVLGAIGLARQSSNCAARLLLPLTIRLGKEKFHEKRRSVRFRARYYSYCSAAFLTRLLIDDSICRTHCTHLRARAARPYKAALFLCFQTFSRLNL
jgi:hypothetical protein